MNCRQISNITTAKGPILYFDSSKVSMGSVCCYRTIQQSPPIFSDSSPCIPLRNKETEIHDFIAHVSCNFLYFWKTYENVHYMFSKKHITAKPRSTFGKYNVMIFGTDSLSRYNLHRKLPQTVAYLKELKALDFKGYNKVGLNTKPNLTPMFFGLHYEEFMNHSCHSKNQFPFPIDDCPGIWKYFSKNGYVSLYAEVSIINFNVLNKELNRNFFPRVRQVFIILL